MRNGNFPIQSPRRLSCLKKHLDDDGRDPGRGYRAAPASAQLLGGGGGAAVGLGGAGGLAWAADLVAESAGAVKLRRAWQRYGHADADRRGGLEPAAADFDTPDTRKRATRADGQANAKANDRATPLAPALAGLQPPDRPIPTPAVRRTVHGEHAAPGHKHRIRREWQCQCGRLVGATNNASGQRASVLPIPMRESASAGATQQRSVDRRPRTGRMRGVNTPPTARHHRRRPAEGSRESLERRQPAGSASVQASAVSGQHLARRRQREHRCIGCALRAGAFRFRTRNQVIASPWIRWNAVAPFQAAAFLLSFDGQSAAINSDWADQAFRFAHVQAFHQASVEQRHALTSEPRLPCGPRRCGARAGELVRRSARMAALATAIWLGWMRVLPSKPKARP